MVRVIRRALLAVGVAGMIAGVLRLRGRGGVPPQRGGWLSARFGKGHYTYCAYAFHRQLPYAVPGAYRLLENLLSLNQPRP